MQRNFMEMLFKKKYSGFEYGWIHHQNKNKHHWDYWVNGNGKPVVMPMKYIRQMVCDWKAMGRKFGDSALSFYEDKEDQMVLHETTKVRIKKLLY